MWIVAWTINDGTDDMVDHWIVATNEAEANAELAKVIDHENLHCWAIGPIKSGSEPQYTGAPT